MYIQSQIQEYSSGLAVWLGWGGSGGWGVVEARLTEKSSDVFFFFFFFFFLFFFFLFCVSLQLNLQRETSDHGFFKENYH